MESITKVYRKAIKNNAVFYLEGKVTAKECDMISRKNALRYMEAQDHLIDFALKAVA